MKRSYPTCYCFRPTFSPITSSKNYLSRELKFKRQAWLPSLKVMSWRYRFKCMDVESFKRWVSFRPFDPFAFHLLGDGYGHEVPDACLCETCRRLNTFWLINKSDWFENWTVTCWNALEMLNRIMSFKWVPTLNIALWRGIYWIWRRWSYWYSSFNREHLSESPRINWYS